MSSTSTTGTRKSIRSAAKPWIIQMVRTHTHNDLNMTPDSADDSADWQDYKAFAREYEAIDAVRILEAKYDYVPYLDANGKIMPSETRFTACGGWGYLYSHFRIVLTETITEIDHRHCYGWTEGRSNLSTDKEAAYHPCTHNQDNHGNPAIADVVIVHLPGAQTGGDKTRTSWPRGWDYKQARTGWGTSCPECIEAMRRFDEQRTRRLEREAALEAVEREAAKREAETVAASDILAGWTTAETESDAQA